MAQEIRSYLQIENKETCVKRNSRPLDFIDFNVCVSYTKGKRTSKRRVQANKTLDVLELIHANICRPFSVVAWNGQ